MSYSISLIDPSAKSSDEKGGNSAKILCDYDVPTIKEIAEIQTNYDIAIAGYVENWRKIDNLAYTQFLAIDIDDGMTGDEFISIMEDSYPTVGYCMVASKNHQIEKNGITCDRFHVLISLDPIYMGQQFKDGRSMHDFYKFLLKKFCKKHEIPFDRNVCDMSRYFSKGSSVYHVHEGEELGIGRYKTQYKSYLQLKKIKTEQRDNKRKKMQKYMKDPFESARKYADKVTGFDDDGHQHGPSFFLACKLVHEFGLCDSECLAIMQHWNTTHNSTNKLSDAALRDKIDCANKYGGKS